MYYNPKTKETFSRHQVKLNNPKTSLPAEPADLPNIGLYYLWDDYRPSVPFGHILVAGDPELVGGKWRVSQTAQPSSVESLKQELKDKATEKRWDAETGGLTLPSGVRVATGIEDQNRITSVIANARLAGLETVSFKALSGWVTLTLADLESVAAAIATHVQQCFSTERIQHDAIDGLQSLAEIEAYSAP